MWIKILLSILTLTISANADIEKLPGPCPEVKPVENFDEEKYSTGIWYPVIHNDPFEHACMQFTVTFSPNKTFHATGIRNGVKVNFQIPFTNVGPGHFRVVGPDGQAGEGVVLDTDYDKYSVHYGCKFDASDNTHFNKFFINVRENYIQDPAGQIAVGKAAIEASGLQYPDNAKPVSHENCDDH